MTTLSEQNGEAWVRQVNKRLALLERIPHTGTVATIAASDLSTDTSKANFEADVIFSAGEQADPSLTAKMVGDTEFDDGVPANDPYSVEEWDEDVPVEGRTDLEYTPVTPSDPIIESRATGVAVIWDGNGAGGESVPVNLLLVEVHRSTEGPTFEPDELTYAGSFLDAGLIAFDDQEYEVQWWYRFVLVTNDGLRSTPSDATDGTAHKIAAGEVGFSASEIDFDGVIANAAGDAADALTAANGKNSVTHSLLPPVAEANTVGDIWFQHAPAAEGGAIIGQFSGLGGTSWEATTLSHQVISSVDLGTATVGKLSANFIESGILSAEITVTGVLMAGDPSGARVILDEDGLRQYKTATDLLINFPTNGDPAQFEGMVLADSLTTKGQFTMQGVDNYVSRGAEFKVSAGSTAIPSAPTVSIGYATYDTGRFVAGGVYPPVGVHANVDDTPDIYASSGVYGFGKMWGPSNRRYVFPSVTDNAGTVRSTYGLQSSSTMIHTAAGAERMVTMGTRCLTNGATPAGSLDTWDVSTMNSSGTAAPTLKAHIASKADDYVYETRLGRVFSAFGTLKERFVMGNRRYLTDDFRLAIFSATDSAITQVGSDIIVSDPFASGETFLGVTYGDTVKMGFSLGSANIWLLHGSVKTYAYNAAGTSRLTDYDFPTPSGMARMAAWGDVATNGFIAFRATPWSETALITKLTNNHWVTGTSDRWWLSSTWLDLDGTPHETTQGARTQIVMKKRAGLTFTIPAYPVPPTTPTADDPNWARVYLGRSTSGAPTTDPGRTYMEQVTTLATPNRSGYIGDFTFPATTATNQPPISNDFPATSAGRFSSDDGTSWVLVGDGTATLAGVAFDGTVAGYTSTAMRITEYKYTDNTDFTASSTTAASMGAKGGSGTFVAPPSGRVRIDFGGLARSSADNQYAAIGIEVRAGGTVGSGTVVLAYAVNDSALHFLAARSEVKNYTVLAGLTPGSTYNIRQMAASGSGSADLTRGRVIITPSP